MNIDKILKNFGSTIYIKNQSGWQSNVFNAFIQPLRYKNKLYLTGDFTPIGKNPQDVYLYIGPKDHNLIGLNSSYRICDANNNAYIIDRAENVMFKNEIIYVWAIIRKVTED